MNQSQHQSSTWMERKDRQTGLEVDEHGYPIVNVIFYGDQPDNVVIEPVPDTLDNPRWHFKQKQWIDD